MPPGETRCRFDRLRDHQGAMHVVRSVGLLQRLVRDRRKRRQSRAQRRIRRASRPRLLSSRRLDSHCGCVGSGARTRFAVGWTGRAHAIEVAAVRGVVAGVVLAISSDCVSLYSESRGLPEALRLMAFWVDVACGVTGATGLVARRIEPSCLSWLLGGLLARCGLMS